MRKYGGRVLLNSSLITHHSSLFLGSDRDEERALVAACDEEQQRAVARVLYHRAQVFDRLERLAVRLLNQVALPQARVRGRARRVYARDDEPLPVRRQAEARGHFGR